MNYITPRSHQHPPAASCIPLYPLPPHPKAHRPLASTSIPLYPLTLPCPALHSIHPHAPMEQPRNPMQPLAPFFGCFLVCLFVFWYACLIVRFSVYLLVCLIVSLVFSFFVGLLVCCFVCLFAWVSVSIVYIVRVIV